MKSCIFRFLDDAGRPADFIGLAAANSEESLFWQIDHHGNPHQCEILPVGRGASICLATTPVPEEEGGWIAAPGKCLEVELEDALPRAKWRRPVWKFKGATHGAAA